MSSYLQNQLSEFKRDGASAAKFSQKRTVPQAVSRPSPTPSISSLASKPDMKRKREEPSSIVYSQPQDTGTGRHLMTQVMFALKHMKEKDKPMSFDDIYSYLYHPGLAADGKDALEHILQTHAKVDYDPKGLNNKGSFRFRPVHNVRSADELLAFLQRQSTAQGIQVRELKDGWTGANGVIEDLEKEGKLLVAKNKKDQTPRMVWPNDPSLIHTVDDEFQVLWHKVKLPTTSTDMRKELVEFGLTPTSQVKAPVQGKAKEKKKRASRRSGKTTNTHMASVLKDFSHLRRAQNL